MYATCVRLGLCSSGVFHCPFVVFDYVCIENSIYMYAVLGDVLMLIMFCR